MERTVGSSTEKAKKKKKIGVIERDSLSYTEISPYRSFLLLSRTIIGSMIIFFFFFLYSSSFLYFFSYRAKRYAKRRSKEEEMRKTKERGTSLVHPASVRSLGSPRLR